MTARAAPNPRAPRGLQEVEQIRALLSRQIANACRLQAVVKLFLKQ